MIEASRIGYDGGEKSCLLDALALCFEKRYPIPEWVRKGLLSAIAAVSDGQGSTWDEVFGSARLRKA